MSQATRRLDASQAKRKNPVFSQKFKSEPESASNSTITYFGRSSWNDIDIRNVKNSYWWNSKKKQENILIFLKGNPASLTEITIQITDKCNRRCIKCNRISFTDSDMSRDSVIKIIKQSRDMGLEHVHLTGGEPTQHPNIVFIIGFCKKSGLRIDLSSNGFFSKDLAIRMCNAGLDQINISYDSLSDVPPGLHYARYAGLNTFVNHMVLPSNYREMPEFIRRLHNDFPFVIDIQLMPPRGTAKKFSRKEIRDYVKNYARPSKELACEFGYKMLAAKLDVVLGTNEHEWGLAEQGIYHRLIDVPCMRGATEIKVGVKGYSPCTYLYRDGFFISGITTPLDESFKKSIEFCFKSSPPNRMCQKSCSPELANFNVNVYKKHSS